MNFDLPGWRPWKEFVESPEFREKLWRYARQGFDIGANIVPKNEEPRKFFRTKEATSKFASRVATNRGFNADMNRALYLFKTEQS